MIGGLFAGLVAPYTFSWVAEYPILAVLAVLCRPFTLTRGGSSNAVFWPAARRPLALVADRCRPYLGLRRHRRDEHASSMHVVGAGAGRAVARAACAIRRNPRSWWRSPSR